MPSKQYESFQRELQSGLRALEARGQRRYLAPVSGRVNLGSNDYLGLAQNPALRAAVAEAVQSAARISGTGSRLLSGHAEEWTELESEFARFAGTEAALYFSTGYAANLGLLSSVLSKHDLVFSDELNHASLIDGIRLSGARKSVYPHLDLNALESQLLHHQNDSARKVIVTETVFSMDGDVAPLAEILQLADRHGACVIVDEAHATAVHGPAGQGIAASHSATSQLLAITHTCGKALASAGAFVCGSRALIDHLINHARTFIFSTAMPPYMAAQIGAALRLASAMDADRAALLDRSRRFAATLRSHGWDTANSSTQIVPVIIGENDDALRAAEFLQSEDFAIRAIRPPTVKPGTARLRFSLTCAIAQSDLDRLAQTLTSWRDRHFAHAAAVRA